MKIATKWVSCLLLILSGMTTTLYAQDAVNVTFTVNTATMPDTLQENHVVQMRGALGGDDVAETGLGTSITWDSASELVLQNAGGDYWTIEFQMSPGDTLNYKLWAGVDVDTPLMNGGEQGWESGDNNQFILPADATADTVAPLQWYETKEAPFTTEDDSITVYFRVNVGAQVQTGAFDPENDVVGVRGNPVFFDNPDDWSTSAFFLEEDAVSGDNYFYSGYTRIQKDSAANIEGDIAYKFILAEGGVDDGNVAWEDIADRVFTIPSADTTLHWAFFSDDAPSDAEIVDTELSFEVNVGILEGLGYFNSSIDTVFVRGTFNNWGTTDMNFNSFSGTYESGAILLTAAVDSEVKYKYYVKWDERRDESTSDYYLEGITHDGSGWEEPGVTGGADRVLTITNSEQQEKRSEFYNGVEPEALLTEDNVDGGAITITFSVDMTPAEDYTADPFDPATDSVYLFIDTPFFALTNDITVPGDNGENFVTQSSERIERLRYTDEDGDGVYTLDLELQLPTLNHIGYRIAYGSALSPDGELLANGGGFDAGRRHYQYIQPQIDGAEITWPSTFAFPTQEWKRDDLPYEMPPSYEVGTSNENEFGNPNQFTLSQNYPNPFNPTTNISFTLASVNDVNLTVYNLLGQKVASLISNKKMSAGTHMVAFDAASLSSGVYFYRIEAGNFVQQRSMTLIK